MPTREARCRPWTWTRCRFLNPPPAPHPPEPRPKLHPAGRPPPGPDSPRIPVPWKPPRNDPGLITPSAAADRHARTPHVWRLGRRPPRAPSGACPRHLEEFVGAPGHLPRGPELLHGDDDSPPGLLLEDPHPPEIGEGLFHQA